jgi:hypothetical protein
VTTDELLNVLGDRYVRLYLDRGRLRYRAPRGTLTTELRNAIGIRRPEIIQRLRARPVEMPVQRCRPTCNHQYWADELPKEGRIRTHCGNCGRFIGYRPAEESPLKWT